MYHQLEIRSLVLKVRLGVTAEERRLPQEVAFSVWLRFTELPSACLNDDLAGSVDYGALCAEIENCVDGREFQLIEFLAHEVSAAIRSKIRGEVKEESGKDQVLMKLEVHKMYPPVPSLQGGSAFVMGDFL